MLKSVAKGEKDALRIRCIHPITEVEVTPTSATVSVFTNGSTPTSIVNAPCTFSGSMLSYITTWNLELGDYRAVWACVDGVDTFNLEQYFSVTKHRWRTPIGSTDFIQKYPYLQDRIPTGSNVMDFILSSWDEIGGILYGRLGHHPSAFLFPEQLSLTTEMLTVSNIYRAISMQPNDSEFMKAEVYRENGLEALTTALSLIIEDSTNTGVPDAVGKNATTPAHTRLKQAAQKRREL